MKGDELTDPHLRVGFARRAVDGDASEDSGTSEPEPLPCGSAPQPTSGLARSRLGRRVATPTDVPAATGRRLRVERVLPKRARLSTEIRRL